MWLFLLQLGHTLIYLAAWGCLIGLWAYGLTGRWRKGLPVFFGMPAVISLGLLLNKGDCIFQTWAKQLSGVEEGWARDLLFIPEPLALDTIVITAPLFLAGLSAAAIRRVRETQLNR
jgi:hypothetical protein